MQVAHKLFPKSNKPFVGSKPNPVIVTEFHQSENNGDKIRGTGGCIVQEVDKSDWYVSGDKLIIVLPPDTKIILTKYDEDGNKIE